MAHDRPRRAPTLSVEEGAERQARLDAFGDQFWDILEPHILAMSEEEFEARLRTVKAILHRITLKRRKG